MVTLNLQVGAGTDGAAETNLGVMYTAATLGVAGDYYTIQSSGLRFGGVSGLSGSTITSAVLTFKAYTSDTGPFIADWYAHDAASPGTFTSTAFNITDTAQRPRTTKTCEADSSDFGNWTSDQEYTIDGITPASGTDTIADIIQELAASHDPDYIALLCIYASGSGERLWDSYETSSADCPKLDITYTTAGGDATLTAVVTTATALSPVSVWTAEATISAVVTTALAESPAAEITGTEAGTIVAAVATATALSPVSTWTAGATLSAVVTTALATSPAAVIFAGAVDWTAFDETQFQLTRSDFPADALFYLEVVMTTSAAENTVKMQLYNVTDSTVVTGSEVSSTATSPEPSLSGGFGFPTGTKAYRLEGSGDTGGSYKWRIAKVLVDW